MLSTVLDCALRLPLKRQSQFLAIHTQYSGVLLRSRIALKYLRKGGPKEGKSRCDQASVFHIVNGSVGVPTFPNFHNKKQIISSELTLRYLLPYF